MFNSKVNKEITFSNKKNELELILQILLAHHLHRVYLTFQIDACLVLHPEVSPWFPLLLPNLTV